MEAIRKSKKMQNYVKRSTESAAKCGDQFEALGIERPEKQTPEQMELKIQADRVMFCVNRVMYILHFMSHIPHFLENGGEMIKKYFERSEATFILNVLQDYFEYDAGLDTCERDYETMYDDIIDKINMRTNPKARHSSDKDCDVSKDAKLAQVIDLLIHNNCLKREIRTAKKPKVALEIHNFMKCMADLTALAKEKLYTTGDEEEARDRRLRQAYKSNIVLGIALDDLKEQLQRQREELGEELNKKVAVFEMYNNKIQMIAEEFQITIEKNIHESEKLMMQQCLQSEEEQTILAEEAKKMARQFDVLLEENLREEKELRIKTDKTEAQLRSWLVKYDQEIGDKQAEFEVLQKEYDKEKAAYDELEEKLEEQAPTYNTLMAEKAEEEQRIYNEMAYRLLLNRSARKIQRYWRAYRERRAARRKGKKGKKDMPRKKPGLTATKKDDMNALLEGKYKGDVFEELHNPLE